MSGKQFGPFGSGTYGTPASRRRRRIQRVFTTFLLFLLGAMIPAAYVGWSDVYQYIIEKNSPVIKVGKVPLGLGSDPVSIPIELSDEDSGLREVVIRAHQFEDVREITRRRFDDKRIRQETVWLNLPGAEAGLREGTVRITITVSDRSIWRNQAVKSLELIVDYRKPEIEILTAGKTSRVGGVQMVFYRLVDNSETLSGIKVGPWLFPGFPAKHLDKAFEYRPDVYFAFFSIPLEFQKDQDQIVVFARDGVGNISDKSLPYEIDPLKRGIAKINIPPTVGERIDKIYVEFQEKVRKFETNVAENIAPSANAEDYANRFRIIQTDYKDLLMRGLQSLFSRPKPVRFWEKRFIGYSPNIVTAPFAQMSTYVYQGKDAGVFENHGLDIKLKKGEEIRASNSGIVIFSDDLGMFGKTIILDHGFGLHTIYSHLLTTDRSEGDRLERGDVLGEAGSSGLAFEDGLHFEMRLHGVPIRPNDWWSKGWIDKHIEENITETKKKLGLRITRILQ